MFEKEINNSGAFLFGILLYVAPVFPFVTDSVGFHFIFQIELSWTYCCHDGLQLSSC